MVSKIEFKHNDIKISGHAIECIINSENPNNFLPSPGKIEKYHPPGGLGVRLESALYQGYVVPSNYDSMIAKLICYGKNRNESISIMKRALEEYIIIGIENSIQLHQDILKDNNFVSGNYNINYINNNKLNNSLN